MVETQLGETAQNVSELKTEWHADKAERQEKERLEKVQRQEKAERQEKERLEKEKREKREQLEKVERQEKEKIEEAQRQRKELTETIAAGETDIICVEEANPDTLQPLRTDTFPKRFTMPNQTQVAWRRHGYES